MKVLLLGGSGQLGQELKEVHKNKEVCLLSPSSTEVNILNDSKLANYIKLNKPEIILNFSAFTNVDLAEKSIKKNNDINFNGVKNIIKYANEFDIPLIHLSTDYVFGKFDKGPYLIDSKLGSVNKYGSSKLNAELEMLNNLHKGIIIRTASLYGIYGSNFFKTFINVLRNKKEIDVIIYQKISITWSQDLALAIAKILDFIKKEKDWVCSKKIDILHLVNKGYTNWYEVASFIALELENLSNTKNQYKVNSILASEWHINTPRPKDSRLKFEGKISSLGKVEMPDWKSSLIKALDLYLE